MKLLLDVNLSPRWVAFLSASGVHSIHWSTIGEPDASDAEILTHARDHDLIVMTHDLDFGAILAATKGERPSVVQLRADDISPEMIGSAVLAALKQLREDLDSGALITVDTKRTRVRILPLPQRT